MKIVVIGTRGFPNVQGGVEKHCERLYPQLVQLGVDVTVLTRKPYVDPSLKEYRGVKLIAVNCHKRKYFETIAHSFKAVFLARKLNPEILHIHAIGPALITPLARLLGLKVVMTHHGPDYKREKWNWFAKLVLRLGEKMGVAFANTVICVSCITAAKLQQKSKRSIEVIPNGVLIPDLLTSKTALNKFSLEKGKYVLAVGRFVPEKGFDDLIDAFALVSNNDWKLVIVGSSDFADAYGQKLTERAKVTKNVILTGFLTGQPLRELYAHAGLFVLPSYYEGLPIVLLEAMGYGLSCLVSDIPANREIGTEEKRYFKPGDVPMLAKKLGEFMGAPFPEVQRQKQVQRIAREFNWGTIASQTLAAYKKVIREKK